MVVMELNVKCLGNDSLKGLQHLAQASPWVIVGGCAIRPARAKAQTY